ncbi:hypothetical protein [Microcoleus sp.]|uniref:hypothetical protein n=1 Tax=Microcoleus sp. TaxID=44472 RepID=UPI00403E47BF
MPADNQVAVAVAIAHNQGRNCALRDEILNCRGISAEVKSRIIQERGGLHLPAIRNYPSLSSLPLRPLRLNHSETTLNDISHILQKESSPQSDRLDALL